MTAAAAGLWRPILQFNLLPSLELHPARRQHYAPAPVWAALAGSRRGHRQLSAHILELEALADDWVTAFETRERRLALLGWRALDRLILLAGVALNAEWIATRIDRDEVAALRASLGRDSYAFAVGRARFLGLSSAWPAPAGDRLAWFRRAGRAYLEACAHGQPHACARRLELRLEPRPEHGPVGADLPVTEPGQATALLRKLAPEVGPECVSLLN